LRRALNLAPSGSGATRCFHRREISTRLLPGPVEEEPLTRLMENFSASTCFIGEGPAREGRHDGSCPRFTLLGAIRRRMGPFLSRLSLIAVGFHLAAPPTTRQGPDMKAIRPAARAKSSPSGVTIARLRPATLESPARSAPSRASRTGLLRRVPRLLLQSRRFEPRNERERKSNVDIAPPRPLRIALAGPTHEGRRPLTSSNRALPSPYLRAAFGRWPCRPFEASRLSLFGGSAHPLRSRRAVPAPGSLGLPSRATGSRRGDRVALTARL